MAQDWFDQATTSAPAASGGPTVIRNPWKARDEARKDAAEGRAQQDQAFEAERLRIAQAQAAIAAAAEARQAATSPFDVRKASADATKAEMAADAAIKEQANAPKPETARIQAALQTDNVINLLNTAREQIGKGWATGNVAGTGAFQAIPFVGQNSTNLSGSLEGIQGNVINDTLKQLKAASANGASGYGSLTETEAQRLAAAVASLKQAQDAPTLLNNLATVERHYRNALALLNNEDPRDPSIAAKYGVVGQQDRDQAAIPAARRPDGQVSSEGTMENDPSLGGVNATVERYIREGKDEGYIRSYLNRLRPGMGDQAAGIGEAIRFNRQYPRDPLNIDLQTVWKPADAVSQTLGNIGMSPFGAGIIGAADTITAGTLDNLTANPETARAAMAGVQAENPWSYLAGQVGGGALTGLGVEAGLGRLGMTGIGRARAGDVLFGTAYGAGSADDEGDSRVAAALLGGGSGLAGGILGRAGARGIGRIATGAQDASVRALNAAGIRMTPGQILGGVPKAVEDRLSGLPFVGDAIRARRMEGLQDFNKAAFEEALDPIGGGTSGVIAEPGIDIARILRSQAYDDALNGVRVTADQPFISDMQATIAAGRNLPDPMASNLDYTLPTRVGNSFDASGNLTGRDFQQSIRGLRRDAKAVENLPYGYDFGQVTKQAEGALEGLLARQSPDTLPAYQAANEANRNVETLRDAVNRARNGSRSGETGVFAPSQLADAAARSAKLYGNSAGTTNQPFYALTRAGQETLPSSIPDSGTAGRHALPAIIGVLAGGGGAATAEEGNRTSSGLATGSVAALLAAAPYSAGARTGLQRLLLSRRPTVIEDIGQRLIDNDRIAGLFAAPALIEYTGQ